MVTDYTHLYLIRHGESIPQVSDVLCDEGLTPLGVCQAERLRDRLAVSRELEADVLISSTLVRARQTAEIIAPALQLPILYDDELQEIRLGEAEGLPYEEFKNKYGERDFMHDPFNSVVPGAENWGQFVLRVGTALDRITRQYAGKTIVLVCHGGVIDCSFLYFFNMGTLFLPNAHFFTQNTSLTYWRRRYNEGKSRWRLVRYNDDFHVRDIDAPQSIPWDVLNVTGRERERVAQKKPETAPTEQ
jgi:probable phosphoglycerate mutase